MEVEAGWLLAVQEGLWKEGWGPRQGPGRAPACGFEFSGEETRGGRAVLLLGRGFALRLNLEGGANVP